MWAHSSFCQCMDTNIYGTSSIKYGKFAMKHPWIYGYFLQCTLILSVPLFITVGLWMNDHCCLHAVSPRPVPQGTCRNSNNINNNLAKKKQLLWFSNYVLYKVICCCLPCSLLAKCIQESVWMKELGKIQSFLKQSSLFRLLKPGLSSDCTIDQASQVTHWVFRSITFLQPAHRRLLKPHHSMICVLSLNIYHCQVTQMVR